MDKVLMEQADISDEDRNKIYYGNFERVFGKVGD